MANLHRISGFLVDPIADGRINENSVSTALKNGTITVPKHLHVDTVTVPDEELDKLMEKGADLALFAPKFGRGPTVITDRKVVVGATYRHFKGKNVKVKCIAQDSEHPGCFDVVYSCSGGVFHRPMDMFLSPVDREKYPDAEQEYRFELDEKATLKGGVTHEVMLEGMLEVPSYISVDALSDMFMDWCEAQGFYFGGGFDEYEAETVDSDC